MKVFLQQMFRGLKHPLRAVTGQNFLSEVRQNLVQKPEQNKNVSGHFSPMHQRAATEFSDKPSLHAASTRQGGIYIKCFCFPSPVTLTILTLTFSSAQTDI